MLKRLSFIFIGIVFSLNLHAQMGVGTDMPDPAAELEIKSTNRGLLIPRIQLNSNTDQNTITAGNIESLLVFNTTSNENLSPGFYYWYNNKWRRLSDDNNLPDNLVIWDDVNNQFTYIDSNGELQTIDLDFDETLTELELSADGKNLIYTDEDNAETIIDLEAVIQQYETLTSLIDNENGTISYFDEDGEETVINLGDASETLTYLIWNQDNDQLIYTDEEGEETTIDLPELIQQYETLTSLVDNENGTISYFDEAGEETVIDLGDASETLTYLAWNQDDDQLIYTDENGDETTIDLPALIQQYETLTSLVDNENGTISYFDEEGAETVINLGDAAETLTYLVWNQDDDQLIYTDEEGEETTIDLPELIQQYETLTSLIDNENGTISYFDEAGEETVINLGDAAETLTYLVWNQDDDQLIYTDENGEATAIDLPELIQQYETLTSLIDNENGTISYFDEAGGETMIDLGDASETLTYLVWNQDNDQLIYTDENGDETTINLPELIQQYETLTSLVDNENGTISYFDEAGEETIIDLGDAAETLTYLVWNQDDDQLIYTDENGDETTIDLEAVIQQYETLTSLVDNENGTISYFDEDGEETVINLGDATETLTYLVWNQDDDQLIYTDENGDETTINLPELIQQYETLTSLVDNENGTISYFDEAGEETMIDLGDAAETLTYLVWNQDDDQLIYTDENGDETVIDLPALIQQYETLTSLIDNENGTISYFDEAGEETMINLGDAAETLTYLIWNQDNDQLIYTDENGDETTIDLPALIQQYETLTSLIDNENGTISYFDEAGEETMINLGDASETLTSLTLDADGNLVYTDENGEEHLINIDNIGETVTTLVDNANGTFTYTNEEGTESTINLEASQQIHITSVDYQPDMGDRIILGDAETNDITITLPDPADFEGRKFTIKKEDNNEDFYLNVSGTIDGIPVGEQLYTAMPYTGWDLVSDGTSWRIVNKF